MIMKRSVSGLKGGEWTSQLCTYFYKENGENEVNYYSLQKCVQDLHRITTSEEIKEIGCYRCPIFRNGEENLLVYHQFVLIKTTNWYWSIEKDSEKILLQRSKTEDDVKKRREDKDRRTPVKIMDINEGKGSMIDVIKFICEAELDKNYYLVSDNCQHFAERLFNQFKKPSQDTRRPNCTAVIITFFIAVALLAYIVAYKRK